MENISELKERLAKINSERYALEDKIKLHGEQRKKAELDRLLEALDEFGNSEAFKSLAKEYRCGYAINKEQELKPISHVDVFGAKIILIKVSKAMNCTPKQILDLYNATS